MSRSAPRHVPIRLRVALWYAGLLLALVGGVGAFLLATLDDVLRDDVDEALHLRASRVERQITTGDDGSLDPGDVEADLLELAPLEGFSARGIYVQVRDEWGRLIATSSNLARGELPVTPRLIEAALRGHEAFETIRVGDEDVRVLVRPVETPSPVVGLVVVGQSLRFIELVSSGVRRLITIAAAVAVGAALAGGWWLTARALGPVADVTHLARAIATTGRFEQRIRRATADDELGRLVATFNDMLERLERTFHAQRDFLADASHELRAPLTVLRGNLDLLRLGLPEMERRASVREASEEVERLARLASDLLFLAASDAEDVIEQAPVRLDEIVAEVCDRARAVDLGAHAILLVRNDRLTILGDRTRLDQLVWNLVENALRYTPRGGRATVELGGVEDRAILEVADTGIGIASEHLPRLFERFYRVDKARSRHEGGTGLGLAIVKRVAEAHGGSVDVRSQPGRGTTFTVALPAPRPDEPSVASGTQARARVSGDGATPSVRRGRG